jgi:hypothetical protein
MMAPEICAREAAGVTSPGSTPVAACMQPRFKLTKDRVEREDDRVKMKRHTHNEGAGGREYVNVFQRSTLPPPPPPPPPPPQRCRAVQIARFYGTNFSTKRGTETQHAHTRGLHFLEFTTEFL